MIEVGVNRHQSVVGLKIYIGTFYSTFCFVIKKYFSETGYCILLVKHFD